jgi:hypothetical protein
MRDTIFGVVLGGRHQQNLFLCYRKRARRRLSSQTTDAEMRAAQKLAIKPQLS